MYQVTKMKQHEILKQSWVWNKTVEKFVEGQISGYSLNVCAGLSPLGDVKIDLDPKHESVIKADMNDLPFENCTFQIRIISFHQCQSRMQKHEYISKRSHIYG